MDKGNVLIIENELEYYEKAKRYFVKVTDNIYHNYLYEYKYIYEEGKLIKVIRKTL